MNQCNPEISTMDEREIRAVMSRAYQCDCHCKAAIVDSSGLIRTLGVNDHEGYSRKVELANAILQQCQSRLQQIYQQRRELQQGLVIHHWIRHLSQLKPVTRQVSV